jgi:hypothetical protein
MLLMCLTVDGFTSGDEMRMAKKIAFMKNIPPHGNLVGFIGFIDENDGEGLKFVIFFFVCVFAAHFRGLAIELDCHILLHVC